MKIVTRYLSNQHNLLRFFVLIVTIILLFICVLYGIGSLLTLTLEDFWCSPYTWDEIADYNRIHNHSYGIGSCYATNRVTVNNTKLFATDINDSGLIVSKDINRKSIAKSSSFLIISLMLTYLIVKYTAICCIDCKRTCTNDWTQTRRKSTIVESDNCFIETCKNQIPNCCFDAQERWQNFYKKNFRTDSPLAIVRTQIKQIVEIVLQS